MRLVQVATDPFSTPVSGAELRNHALATAISPHASVKTVAICPLCVNRSEISVRRRYPTLKQLSGALTSKVLNAILGCEPHVVLLEGVELLNLAEAICQQRQQLTPRLIFDFHNVESCLHEELDSARLPATAKWLARMLYGRSWRNSRRAEVRAAELADQVWVCSETDAARLAKLLPGDVLRAKIKVVPNVVPQWCESAIEQEFVPQIDFAQPRALFLGHLRYPPNVRAVHRLLADIWPAIQGRFPRMQLTVAGRRPAKSLQRRILRTPGAHLTVNPTDLNSLYQDTDLVLVPLDQGGGSRLKILEALALGKPVVATGKAVEGLNLIADEHWLPAHDSAQFVTQAARLIEDAALRRRLSIAGRELVRARYTCSAITSGIGELLKSLQEGRESPFDICGVSRSS